MNLPTQQHNLVALYHSGSRMDTIAQLREAIHDVDEPDVRADLMSAIAALEDMSDMDFDALTREFEGGMCYRETR